MTPPFSSRIAEDPALLASWLGPLPDELSVTAVGGCVVEEALSQLGAVCAQQGTSVDISYEWPGSPGPVDQAPDIVVGQWTIQPVLRSLDLSSALADPEQLTRACNKLTRILTAAMGRLSDRYPDATILFHNYAIPPVMLGRTVAAGRAQIIAAFADVNARLSEKAQGHGNVFVVDEESLIRQSGAGHLYDHELFPSFHHGSAVDPANELPIQQEPLLKLLAIEYLALYVAAQRTAPLRLVVTDLDGTLWPGILAEDGIDVLLDDVTSSWIHQGISEALLSVHRKGVLLASASRGDEAITAVAWSEAVQSGLPLIPPDRFVDHRIGWQDKPSSIRHLSSSLGIHPSEVCFIDNSHVERASVAHEIPEVLVLGRDLDLVRAFLLTSPRFDAFSRTMTGSERTEVERTRLRRDHWIANHRTSPAYEEPGWLQDLSIEAGVYPVAPKELARAAELISRTNQFTTTSERISEPQLTRLAASDDWSILVLRVADRFGDYGLVGVSVVGRNRVRLVVLSCRVLPLHLADVFLGLSVEHARQTPTDLVLVDVVETGRNSAALSVLDGLGLEPAPSQHRSKGEHKEAGELRQFTSSSPLATDVDHATITVEVP